MRNYVEIPVAPKGERSFGGHPAQKPLRLMELLVQAGTNEGDKVIDCFSGSGSTVIACDRLNRRWVGIERDGKYCDIAQRRLDEDRKLSSEIPRS